ncbi:MAG: ABC transporter permease [Calditrichaeota bacterium]|nr:MAG: ABC transporter permease [Calditrichota bacterium]
MMPDKKGAIDMFGNLVQKELKAISTSPKFVATFLVCSFLMIVSVFIGINEYKQAVIQYETVHQLADEGLNRTSNWRSISYREHRKPSSLQIFSSGLAYDIGRWSDIDANSTVKMKHSIYSDDPIFAVFRVLDFTFIVQIVFSLLAILFTFDAINGEKENGTLRLIFSNSVPRTTYLLAKAVGSWLGLIVPILLPILISLLLVVLYQVPMTGDEWIRLILLIAVSILYITFFILFGLFISSTTSRSSVSFMFSLVFWIAFVLIIPRGGVVAAGHIVSVPSLGEIEGMRDAYAKNKWETFYAESEKRWQARDNEEREEEVNDDEIWARMNEEDSIRKVVTLDIEDYESLLMDDWKNKQRTQQNLGFALARFSPAATYQLATTTLSVTDLTLKSIYEEAFTDYRKEFNDYIDEKSADAGPGAGAVMITMDSEKGFDLSMGKDNAIDVSDRPLFVHPKIQTADILGELTSNVAILLFMILLVLIGSYISFTKYDLR